MKKYYDTNLSALERATALVDEMTVEEQVGQLKYNAEPIERLEIPAYNWWNEGLHGLARSGIATIFPQAIGLAATFDLDLVQKCAEITSTEARAKYNAVSKKGDRDIYKGITLWSPNINIFRDPRWGRGQETFGEDPYLTAEMGKRWVNGLQGEQSVLKTAACAKHFAVHSGPENLRHGFNAEVSKKDLEETYLPAFRKLVQESKVEAVMGAYNAVNGYPSCASPYLHNLLDEWGFDGYFVSDCWAIQDFHAHHKFTSRPEESASMAIKSGCDLNCGCTYERLLNALKEGLISKEEIRTAAIHVMRTRIRLGMFDKATPYDDIPYEVVSCSEHKAVSLQAAVESTVLLKNDGILPLDEKKIKSIAVIGPTADSRVVLEGNYNGTADRYVTLLNGIQDVFSGRVYYSEGCHLYLDRTSGLAKENDRLAEALTCAELSDVVVLCVGLNSTIEGEEGDTGNEFSSGDKKDIYLPDAQKILVHEVMKLNKPTILVTAAGSCIHPQCNPNAWLHIWYPGSEGGTALAQILFGKKAPSGKLPVTFYENADLLPDFVDYSMKNRTYRYTQENILYPFGHGLTYGKIKCNHIQYESQNVTVEIENTSDFAVTDVVQIYCKDYSKWAVDCISLAGFQKITLSARETKKISINLNPHVFTAVDDQGNRQIFGDKFILYAGTCQPIELAEQLSDTKCVQVEVQIEK